MALGSWWSERASGLCLFVAIGRTLLLYCRTRMEDSAVAAVLARHGGLDRYLRRTSTVPLVTTLPPREAVQSVNQTVCAGAGGVVLQKLRWSMRRLIELIDEGIDSAGDQLSRGESYRAWRRPVGTTGRDDPDPEPSPGMSP
jgi:hypothetical protein